jgi:imidazolonepropionase-like amidohydrolase
MTYIDRPGARDDRLVVVADGAIVADGTPPKGPTAVIVHDGRIESLVPAGDLGPHDQARAVRFDGYHTMLPGLVNSHVHLTVDSGIVRRPFTAFDDTESDRVVATIGRLRRMLVAGITTVRDTGASDRGLFSIRNAIDRGELVGPRVFTSGAILCCTGGHAFVIGREADGATAFARAAREEIKAGADFLKLMVDGGTSDRAIDVGGPSLTDEEIRAAVQVGHRLGKRITAHAIAPATIDAALRGGVDAIEHGYQLTRPQAELMAERETYLVPTMSVHAAPLRQEEAPPWIDLSRRSREFSRLAVARAIDAGVLIAAGTDGGSPFNEHHDLVGELLLMNEVGMQPQGAIESATRVGAELLGISAEVGTLRPGMRADLVVVPGDPILDLEALCSPVLVVKDGQVVHAAAGRRFHVA